MPSEQLPAEQLMKLIGNDDLVQRILRSRGGQRLLAMSEREMQQFLSGAESVLTIPAADGTAVRASLEDARIATRQRCDLYLGGGGIPNAVALAGAATVLEERGYAFQRLAGTSAGALVATLLAVGYTCAELRDILLGVDYGRFVDHGSGLLQRVRGTPLYSLDYLLAWLRHLMQAKGAMTFGDLRSDAAGWAKPSERYRLIVFATELTSRGRVRLPIDITGWGREPDELELAWAVSATLAEPGLFEPVKVQTGDGKTLALGGDAQLDVHEVGVFDRADGQAPQFPTFGAWLISDVGRPLPSGELDRDRDRTIMIPVPDLSTTEFAVSREQLISLYDTGRSAAERFLASWDFARYLEAHGTS